jgi:hypothetical protein
MDDREFSEFMDRAEEFHFESTLTDRLNRASPEDLQYLCDHGPSSVRYAGPPDQLTQRIIGWILDTKLYQFVEIDDLIGKRPKIKHLACPWEVVGNTWSKIAHLPSCVPNRNPRYYRPITSNHEADSLGYRGCRLCRPFQVVPIFVGKPETKVLHAINCGCSKKAVKRFVNLRQALSVGYGPCPVIENHIACAV